MGLQAGLACGEAGFVSTLAVRLARILAPSEREPLTEQPGLDPAKPSNLRELFRRHSFHPRRSLGQTFLVDANIVRKIVRAAELTGEEPVLEIGAGAGAVTCELTRQARRVIALEIDPVLVRILHETVGDTATIVQGDVLAVDWESLLGHEDKGRWRVVANLPYAITGPAIIRLLELIEWVDRMVIMVQQEVAERLLAKPGGRTRGILSVLIEAACEITEVGTVAPTCFRPIPEVQSTILTLTFRRPQLVPDHLLDSFRELIKGAFGTRRKTLANAIAGAQRLQLSKEEALLLLSQCHLDPRRRAEDLSADDFLCLTRALEAATTKGQP